MNLIFSAKSEHPRMMQEFRNRGCSVAEIPLLQLINAISQENDQLLADAVICFADPEESDVFDVDEPYYPDAVMAIKVEKELRSLADELTMPDGRKWKSIPFLILSHRSPFSDIFTGAHKDLVLRYEGVDGAFRRVEETVRNYRRRLLDDLDNLGFLVKLESGRYRIGPALKPRKDLESEYYHSLGDRREHGIHKLYTVDRDLYGIQYEIEQFEALINRPDVIESDLQQFFEANPHFIVAAQLMHAIPHARLEREGGRLLIPDFILKPIVAMKRDSKWEVLDLKTPQVKLLVGKQQRIHFSHHVMKAITQLRHYGEYFKDPGNSETVRRVLGHQLKHPKLAVLIGRLQEDHIEALELAQSREPDVRIVTYDEILEQQKRIYESRLSR